MASDQFKRLQAHWYAKLRASGFDDIEDAKGDIRLAHQLVRTNDERHPFSYTVSVLDNTRRYYELAEHLAESLTRRDPRRKVWILHAQGYSDRELERRTGVSRYLIGQQTRELRALILEQARQDDEHAEGEKVS